MIQMQAVERTAMCPLKESHRIHGGKHQEFNNLEKISLGTKALVFLWNTAQYMQYLFVLAVFVETMYIDICYLHCSLRCVTCLVCRAHLHCVLQNDQWTFLDPLIYIFR